MLGVEIYMQIINDADVHVICVGRIGMGIYRSAY